ncbi:hypothetical protein SAMN05443253_1332 [Bacillus sp. OK048]|nr:hypothetical protein SAMN05443253_1332 [Bacillus sp. OK048]
MISWINTHIINTPYFIIVFNLGWFLMLIVYTKWYFKSSRQGNKEERILYSILPKQKQNLSILGD